MILKELIAYLDSIAPPSLQESYDNVGLIVGDPSWESKGVICTLDVTVDVIHEAIQKNCNCIVAHHPIIFGGLKKLTGSGHVEQTVIAAIKNDIAIYAIHTNLDNVLHGVSGQMAEKLGLKNISILAPKAGTLNKLFTFVPSGHAASVRDALFAAGAGHIGNYSECSFNSEGTGTFKGGADTNPFVGKPGQRHEENEVKIELIFPAWLERSIIEALKKSHPYEEVAYDIVALSNINQGIGSGVVGDLPGPLSQKEFLQLLIKTFSSAVIRHTSYGGKMQKIALCGGAGSFLIHAAMNAGAQAFVTGDIKYHDFFEANGRLLVADIGHFESERFTIDLLAEVLARKFPTFAVLKTAVDTNPVKYFQ